MRTNREWGRRLPAGRLVLWAAALALLVLFIAENFLLVEIRLIVTRVETRLAWALIIAALLGFLVGYFWPRRR